MHKVTIPNGELSPDDKCSYCLDPTAPKLYSIGLDEVYCGNCKKWYKPLRQDMHYMVSDSIEE